MPWPKTLCMLVAGAVLMAAGLAVRSRPSEPAWRGRPLTYWVDHLSSRGFGEAYDAIRAIGADSVPWLLASAQRAHAVHRQVERSIWPHLPQKIRARWPSPLPPQETEDKVIQALSLLDEKGVPGLVQAFGDTHSCRRRVAALAIGKMLLTDEIVALALGGLSRLLADSDESVQMAAMSTLEKMGSAASDAVPDLITILRPVHRGSAPHPSPNLQTHAARLLGQIGPDARTAIPALSELLQSEPGELRVQAAIALWRISGDTNVAPVLVEETARRGILTGSELLSVLGQMGPAAQAVAPFIVRQLETFSVRSFGSAEAVQALQVLERVDRQAAEAVRNFQEQARLVEYLKRAEQMRPSPRR